MGYPIGSIEYAWNLIDSASDESWDDLKEYEPCDFQSRYGTNEEDSNILWMAVQPRFDNRRTLDTVADAQRIVDQIAEAQHLSFDVWSTRERLTIEAFLSDIAWAVYNDDPQRHPK